MNSFGHSLPKNKFLTDSEHSHWRILISRMMLFTYTQIVFQTSIFWNCVGGTLMCGFWGSACHKRNLFDFADTHAISTHFIAILVGFSFKTIAPLLHRQDWYQKMWNFLAHLLVRSKLDFWWSVPRKLIWCWHQ